MEVILNNSRNRFLTPGKILMAGLFVGCLDGIAAIINYLVKGGKHPEKIFNFIASGIFGKEGLNGGTAMVIWGVVFHLLIACTWTLIFYLTYSRIKAMRNNRILTGIVYGILVWAIMTRLVLPLSNAPRVPFKADQAMIGAAILVIAIGLPLSFIAHKQYVNKPVQTE